MGLGYVFMRASRMFEIFHKQTPRSERLANAFKTNLASGKGVCLTIKFGRYSLLDCRV